MVNRAGERHALRVRLYAAAFSVSNFMLLKARALFHEMRMTELTRASVEVVKKWFLAHIIDTAFKN